MFYKIIFISGVVVILSLIEVGFYFLLRKIQKNKSYSQKFLDESLIYGIGIIVVIAIMLWQNIE